MAASPAKQWQQRHMISARPRARVDGLLGLAIFASGGALHAEEPTPIALRTAREAPKMAESEGVAFSRVPTSSAIILAMPSLSSALELCLGELRGLELTERLVEGLCGALPLSRETCRSALTDIGTIEARLYGLGVSAPGPATLALDNAWGAVVYLG